MRKIRSAYLKPYIRRAKPKDFDGARAQSLRTAIRMALYEGQEKAYVLVQRGSSKVVEIAGSREELKRMPLACRLSRHPNKEFNRWRNRIKHFAQED